MYEATSALERGTFLEWKFALLHMYWIGLEGEEGNMPAAFLPHKTIVRLCHDLTSLSLTPISQEGGFPSWRREISDVSFAFNHFAVRPSVVPSFPRSFFPDGVYGVSALRFGFPFLAALVAESRRECAE